MTVKVPDGGDRPPFPWRLHVKLTDLKNTLLAESETILLDGDHKEKAAAPER